MQKEILLFALTLTMTSTLKVNAQNVEIDSTYKRWFVGSTVLLLGNLDKTNNPGYIQFKCRL